MQAPASRHAVRRLPSDNLLDRVRPQSTLDFAYRRTMARERALVTRRLALSLGEALSVGVGWPPGRHLLRATAVLLRPGGAVIG
jgi:hypothetical protein